MTLAFVHATALCPERDSMQIRRIDDATVVVEGDRIESVRRGAAPPAGAEVVDARGRLLTPGLVDSHTHALFLGDRAAEFCERAAGATYLEIAQRGGGIQATVKASRGGGDELTERARQRLLRLARNGVTTVEVKTGYGLSAAEETRHLSLIAGLETELTPAVYPTLMAAHAVPPEVKNPEERREWLRVITDELIPDAARHRPIPSIDVFVERTAYTPDEARLIAKAAQRHLLPLHLHVDQLSEGGGAALAAELGAQAVAHLERVSPAGISALARAKSSTALLGPAPTVAVLLPTATLAAGEAAYAPARALIDAGVPVALATNLNPGTGPTESTSVMFFLAAIGLHMTAEEILWAATRGGARALGVEDLGLLDPDCHADLVLWNAHEPAHLPYHAAVNHVRQVWRCGRLIVDRRDEVDRDCDGML